MKPSNLFNSDDRAVSPVIGVILMVAITVILAAVIGTFVLGLGDSLGDSQPTAQLDAEITDIGADDTANLTIEHGGGDRIDAGAMRIVVSNSSGTEVTSSGEFTGAFTVGDIESGEFNTTASGSSGDIRIRIIHQPSDSILLDQTVQVDEFDGVSGSDITFN
ncbi:type IV pilin [Halorubrum sp. Ea8]|uniref:type IV pilin n=1 Tax=Halorubrum sp. Ea8 TaxID=1383841 RepID=UPI000B981EAA|nr:type IV pilin N-terminal domain-containing protein [Halorubrum sp. Ea8]OYR51581.1 hypothetical protein DJ74_03630 [Halorubrum sp. Ea8]